MTRYFFVALLVVTIWRNCPAEEIMTVSEVPDRDQMLGNMAEIVARSIVRHDSRHAVFHGCYDWHSSVHGHWALLRVARVTGAHQDKAQIVERSLSAEGIAREAESLRGSPGFEMPYGRAWFLRLAIDFELWALQNQVADPQRLRAMAKEVSESMLARYERNAPNPNSREYGNASWALVQLYAYALHAEEAEFQQRTEALISKHMLAPQVAPSFPADAGVSDFFSPFGNWAYLIAKTQSPDVLDDFLRKHPLPDDDIQPVPLRSGSHPLGMTWSRAWSLRALSRLASDADMCRRFDRAYLAHVEAGRTQYARHAGSYGSYDHWVPQFAVYALTE